MTVYYFKDSRGNVGDDLNALILRHFFDFDKCSNASYTLVGIGTLINNHLPLSKEFIFFTTGYGYQKPPKFSDTSVSAIGLRGPMTLAKLRPFLKENEKNIPLLDGAYLTPDLIPKNTTPEPNRVGLIPHVDSMQIGRWEEIAKRGQFYLIDPRWEPSKFIDALTSCTAVITEAMHGAILADAYRVPWTGFAAHSHINTDKWHDWSESLSIPLQINSVSPVFKGDEGQPFTTRIKNIIKRTAQKTRLYNNNWTLPPVARSTNKDMERTLAELKQIAAREKYQLSDYAIVQEKLAHLRARIDEFNANKG
ncbi:succinoglycan biosynthesis protein exov [Alteromonas sp. 345S023]|uniref:Succinoglycan biosynthesis protein exov n=1 Tax=Alteromonas profundi TaxID=2696062 RepID=A0A7X5LL84_9ALTE|nr:polysaccharide pyruvyl transferase family protein [Alteromonas profundi]NDV91401.1 succinoglycan biosynthesis protein exov [Alteromonas profundi]